MSNSLRSPRTRTSAVSSGTRPWLLATLGLLPLFSAEAQQRPQARLQPVTEVAARVARPAGSAAAARPSATASYTPQRRVTAAIASTATGGNWSDPATWVGGAVPAATDDVTIVGGATVTLDVAASCGSLTVAATGSLVNSATTGYKLEVAGNVTNNGTLDLSASSTIGSDLRFTGAGNATFTGTGTTDLQTMSLAKAVRADVVEMNLPTLSVKGSATATDGFLFTRTTAATPADDMTGTLKITGTATLTNRVFGNAASYIIPATGGFWLDNPNFTVASQTGSPTVNGLLRISSGTFNVGNTIGNSINFGASSVYTMEGGTLNTVGRFTSFTSASAAASMTFTLSGGTLNVSTVGNASGTPSFGVNGTTNISGGTINLVQRSTATTPLDYYVAGTYNFTGGTVNLGTAATATNFDFRVRGSFPNLTLDNTTNAKSAVLQGQTNVFGTLLTTTGTTLNLNSNLLLQLGATITNNGTLTGTTSTATSTSTLYFGGSTAQTFGGTGTVTAPLRALTVDNSGGGVTLSSPIVTSRVNLFTGNLNGTSNLTVGDGSAVFNVIQIGVAANTGTSGSFASAPTFNLGTGALQLIYAPETTNRTTGFEIPSNRVVDVISIANPAGVTLAGGPVAVPGVSNASLLLTNGILTTSAANTLVLGPSAGAIPTGSATSYVKGPLAIAVNSTTPVSRTFAVGDAAGWRPVVVNGITTTAQQIYTATVVSGPTGGSGTLLTLNPTRYVRLENTANLPATATVQLSYGADDTGIVPATAVVAQAATANGTYASLGGAAATTPTTGITSVQNLTPGNDFFVLASPAACNATFTYPNATYCTTGLNPTPSAPGTSGGIFSSTTGLTIDPANGAILLATSTPGTYTVTYSAGASCTATTTVTITAPATAGFSFGATSYCTSATAAVTPTLATGATAGTFSSTTGLSLDATTGAITPSTSTPGTYTVTNTVAASGGCAAVTSTATVTITAPQTAGFSYASASYCTTAAAATPALATGATAGTFSSTNGLTLDAATGAITPSTSTPGTYTVTNTVAASGGCAAVASTATVTITAPQTAGFSYAAATACAGAPGTLAPTLAAGATAGSFSSTTGLSLNAATGAITPGTSVAGTYTVTNTVAASGGCAAVSSTATVTINAAPAQPTVAVAYTTPGTAVLTASAAPAGAAYQWYVGSTAIAGATGQSYTANGTAQPGAYTVVVTSAQGCASPASAALTVTATSKPLAGTSLNVFPNPTHDGQVTLELTGYSKTAELTVLNALGQVVRRQTLAAGQSKASVDLSAQPAGVYLLRVATAGGTDLRRIVRE
jgi:hypothetical protein